MDARQALARWGRDDDVHPEPDAGLINRTYRVGWPPSAVLQWLNPIFDPRIHHDMAALAAHLSAGQKDAGEERPVRVPRVLPTAGGELWVDDPGGGAWRLLSWLPGETVHRVESAERARAAGDLVGRFHAAVGEWRHDFAAPPRHIHDSEARMDDLRRALDGSRGHPLGSPARELGERILAAWERWRSRFRLDLPERPCHGDLKISNLRFRGGEAFALLDLDTLGPQTLAAEMGDAWRSWCNPAGEDDVDAVRFDVDLFAASAEAWAHRMVQVDLSQEEIASLVPGIERICLELASRFCADAVVNDYFYEDRERHPEPGRHNLVRAEGQARLAASAREARDDCREILEPILRRGPRGEA